MTGVIIRRVLYPAMEWRDGTRILANLRRLCASQYAPEEALADLRLRKLRLLVRHAFENVPFYHERFSEAGMGPADIKTFDDLRRLPPLTKDDIASNLPRLRAANIPASATHAAASGGSTGRYTPFYRDNACMSIKRAAQLRFDSWCGWQVGDKVAYVWPAVQDLAPSESLKQRLRRQLIERMLMLNAGSLDEETIVRHGAALRRFSPKLIRAFPNPLSVLARYLRDEGGEHGIRPAGILTTGEPLLPGQRTLFEDVFGCKVFDCYASRECGQHACECEAHGSLHVNAEALHLEFEWDGRAVAAGQPGEILITDLENLGMPFLRYRIEDVGIPLAGACPCGRTLPRMAVEAGRVSDFVISPHDGSLVSGAALCHYLVACGPDVGQIQVVQDGRDHLTIRIRKERDQAAVNAGYIEATIARLFHGAMRVTFEERDTIPHEKSGKYRFCVNTYSQRSRSDESIAVTYHPDPGV